MRIRLLSIIGKEEIARGGSRGVLEAVLTCRGCSFHNPSSAAVALLEDEKKLCMCLGLSSDSRFLRRRKRRNANSPITTRVAKVPVIPPAMAAGCETPPLPMNSEFCSAAVALDWAVFDEEAGLCVEELEAKGACNVGAVPNVKEKEVDEPDESNVPAVDVAIGTAIVLVT